jgi:hypothetical protein
VAAAVQRWRDENARFERAAAGAARGGSKSGGGPGAQQP